MNRLAETAACTHDAGDVVGLFVLILVGLAIGFALGVNSARRR